MVNPYHPEPQGPPPRLDWKDKWALYARSHQPGYRDLLNTLLQAEQELHRWEGGVAGRGRKRQGPRLVQATPSGGCGAAAA